MAFGFGQQGQVADALLQIGHDRLEQHPEVPRHALDGGGIEQVARVPPARLQSFLGLPQRQGEIELGAFVLQRQVAHFQSLQGEFFARGVLEHEHHLE